MGATREAPKPAPPIPAQPEAPAHDRDKRYYIGRAVLSASMHELADRWVGVASARGVTYRRVTGPIGLRYVGQGLVQLLLNSTGEPPTHPDAHVRPIQSPLDLVQRAHELADSDIRSKLDEEVEAYGVSLSRKNIKGKVGLTVGVGLHSRPDKVSPVPPFLAAEHRLFGRLTDAKYSPDKEYDELSVPLLWLHDSGHEQYVSSILMEFRYDLEAVIGANALRLGGVDAHRVR